ncbi:MAG: cation:proton antiporter [Nanobdellota archaeon]
MEPVVILLISLSLAFLISHLAVRLSLPSLLGPLLAGIILSIPIIQSLVPIDNLSSLFSIFSDLGIILLLFYIGLKINVQSVKASERDVTFITLCSTFIPAIFAFVIVLFLGYSWIAALSIAIVLAVSDESVSLVLLDEAKLLKSKIGQLIISSGVLDDVLSIFFIGIMTIFFVSSQAMSVGLLRLLIEMSILIGFLFFLHYIVLPFIHNYYTKTSFKNKYDLFTVTFILVLVLASFSYYLHFGFAIGALIAGVLVRSSFESNNKKEMLEEAKIDDMFKTITFGFVMLLFFISIGLNIDFSSLNLLLVSLLVVIGLFGKWFGALIGYFFAEKKFSFRVANLVGWGLGARGAMALIVLEIARSHSIIPSSLFSSVVFVAIITTVLAPVMFRFFVKHRTHHFKHPHK